MAVLTNTMMQGTAADTGSGDDAYQIEKSLRFNDTDEPVLKREFLAGNTRTWTWAAWVKRSKTGVQHNLFSAFGGDSNNQGYLVLESDDAIAFDQRIGGTWSNSTKTNKLFRDTSAWFHITFVFDSTNAPDQYTEVERIRLFINGERVTSFSDAPNCTENLEGKYNSAMWHEIGKGQGGSNHMDGYLADVHFIDGLALSPFAFGSFDSTGVFNPKAFALPTPNDGTTWSSGVAADSGSDTLTNAANGFNGDVTNGIGGINGGWTWTVPSGGKIENVYSLRFHSASSNTTGTVKFNGNIIDTAQNFGSTLNRWYDVPTKFLQAANYEVTSLSWNRQPGQVNNTNDYLYAVEVNGVLLIDGRTDVETRNNLNDGRVWSDTFTGTFHSNGQGNAVNTFDGSLGTQSFGADASTLTFLPPSTITANTAIEIYVYTIGSITGQNDLKVNNSSIYSAVNTANGDGVWGWYDIGTTLNSTHGLVVGRHDNSNKVNIKAIRVDGQILIDSTVDNSFHLKFNDTSLNRYLGKDTLNSKIEDATGGKPILVTTDDYGDVTAGTVDTSDANKSDIILALSGHSAVADVHHTVKGSGSALTLSAGGSGANPVISTTSSRYYGSAIYFDGNNHIKVPHSSTFQFGSGASGSTSADFTWEFWFKPDSVSGLRGIIGGRGAGGGNNGALLMLAHANLQVNFPNNDPGLNYDGIVAGHWYHVAVSRNENNIRLFVNGALIETITGTDTIDLYPSSSHWYIGDSNYGSGTSLVAFRGYIQDFRMYTTAKYTAAFKPPTRNDFTVDNLTHSTTGGDDGPWTGSPSGFRSGGSDWNGGTDITDLESGDSYATSGNNAMLQIDTSLLGKYDLTITKTSGDDIHFYTSNSDSSGYGTANPSGTVSTFAKLTNVQTPTHTYSRYLRMGGASSGNAVFTITGVINMPDGVSTAIADLDASVDTPTNYLPTDGDDHKGGVIRANYATWNPLDNGGATLSEGNLKCTAAGTWNTVRSTISVTSGKWYAEFQQLDGGTGVGFGVAKQDVKMATHIGNFADSYCYYTNGQILSYNNSYTNYGASYTLRDVIGLGFDYDAGTLTFYKNGTSQGVYTISGGCSGAWSFATAQILASNEANFGQRAFKYNNAGTDRPADTYKPLCTHHIDDTFSGAELNNPSKYFGVTTYTGTGASRDIKGVGFGPDLIWVKERSGSGDDYQVYDQVRGTGKRIRTNTNDIEATQSGGVNAFLSDGWTQGDAGTMNNSGDTYVGWLWDAGTAASGANNDGSTNVASGDQWKNAIAGFSMTKYEGNGAARTIGHGLGAKPDFWITKDLEEARTNAWRVWHTSLSGMNYRLELDENDGEATSSTSWNNTPPDNSVFSLGADDNTNKNGNDYIMYCWTAISGYSAFGKYTGNDSADGPFVYTGMSPKWIMIKNIDQGTSAADWLIYDTERSTFNAVDDHLYPNRDIAEAAQSTHAFDIVSNGFKVRSSSTSDLTNSSGDDFIYAAFAEHPFKTARAK